MSFQLFTEFLSESKELGTIPNFVAPELKPTGYADQKEWTGGTHRIFYAKRQWFFTGKAGINFKTKKQSFEFAHRQNGDDFRMWVDLDGNVTEADLKEATVTEGAFIVKNLDGKEKRFKDENSKEAKEWAKSSSPKKATKKYSQDWWSDKIEAASPNAHTVMPWTGYMRFTDPEVIDEIVRAEFRSASDVDWTVAGNHTDGGSARYDKKIGDCPVTALKIRVSYTTHDDKSLSDSQVIGVHRDVKDPTKWVFDKFF